MVDLNGQLRLHERCRMQAVRIGREGLPVLIVDEFLNDPDILIEYAARHCRFESESDTFYPGVRAPAPAIYCFALRAFLGDAIASTFGLTGLTVERELSHFSLVTTAPPDLRALQRMPHFDNPDPRQLAVLHYLCPPQYGGTSFYRHRGTRFEFIDEPRRAVYSNAVERDLAALGPMPGGYICGDDAMFERTATFEAVFNRVLVYRSVDLHSADVAADCRFDPNPRTGRLTANTFLFYR